MAAARAWTTPAEEEEATAAEASSATAASKRRRLSSPQHPRGMPPTPAAAGEAAAGKEEVEAVTESVAAAAQLPKLPTLDDETYFDSNPIQESAADTILTASKFVLGLSAYIDGVLLKQCSGILMEWSEGTGTILTTADLICSRHQHVDEWLGGEEYAPNAEVSFFEIKKVMFRGTYWARAWAMLSKEEEKIDLKKNLPIDPPKRLPRFRKEVMFADDIFLLGRDKLDLQIGDGKVLNKGAGSCQRHHYMYYDGGIFPCGFGGAVIDLEGDVIGMVHSSIDFIPSSTILKCLHLWRTFRIIWYSCVPRIHLGMKCLGIKCLNLVSKEKISQKYRVDAGLIIVEVLIGSNAEKLGVRMGDIIQAVNGECIATAVQLEHMLLDICRDHLEKELAVILTWM
ncbi:uncharacterized protein [Setaria viridis]|uniref:uncharacterized protein n=1 Tax=Setaria viridis TaxID=4556 RepID=UPI003B3AD7CD